MIVYLYNNIHDEYHSCFFFNQKTAYDMRSSDWSSDVCSSDLFNALPGFDPLRDTLIGNDTRRLAIENGPGQSRSVDLSEGRGVALFLAGMSFEWSPDESIKITNRLNVTAGDANTIGQIGRAHV